MWCHILVTLNAADLISRGCSREHLLQGKWWKGPTWLLENEENWPKSEDEADEDLVNSEKHKKLLFYNKIRKIACDSSETLSVSELKNAEIALVHLVQKESFKNIKDDKLKQLRPIIDCNGLIRVKTNFSNRHDTDDFRFPIILPSDHTVVKLLIMNAHNERDLLQAGTSMLMSHLREKYLIIKARKEFYLKDRCIYNMAYIVLYTCAVYRAIHLELITSCTTETFFQSLRRFISRHGRPTTIYSDNGMNFKGAERLLHALDWDSILARVAEEKIQWKFNPPSAPWWGGWWERLVRMTKAILRKILGRAALDYEELITVLCDPLQTTHLRVRRR
ncbi:integrase catalytic domain-containing protein [Trichonephila clavipes]|nr:integrase catalytic domain-containing protein [Trichonephila clavipes]